MNNIDWPGGASFAVCLTHDVDRVKKTRFHSLFYLLKERKSQHIVDLFEDRRVYWNFERITKMEEQFSVKSSFFFLNEQDLFEDRPRGSLLRPHEWERYYSSYRINDPAIAEVIRDLDRRSWEVALHGSYESFARKDMLAKEKHVLERVLGKKVIGVRQHYLRLDIPKTWELQREVGFRYDSSYGAHKTVEARDEWIRPFMPLDSDFLVIPVTIMDGYLLRTSPNLAAAWERCREILKWARKKRGVVTVIWHSQQFNEGEFRGWSRMYEKILVEGTRMNAWMAPAREIYELLGRASGEERHGDHTQSRNWPKIQRQQK